LRASASGSKRPLSELYGIASKQSKDVDEFFVTRGEAERALEQVLQDEPDLAEMLYVTEIDFGLSAN
jgi:hypothetical protein